MKVSIIIPTAGASDRRSSLFRAVDSILNQEQVDALPVVVLNGQSYDRDLAEALKQRNDIRFHYREQPSLPGAINFGRREVKTPFFGFLDDDDYYHPWAVSERLMALEASPDADAVVSWGEREVGVDKKPVPRRDIWNPGDPLDALLKGCWLASCSGLFRTETVSPDYFDPELRHLEWTSVAFRMTLDRSLMFLKSERPHFLIADSPSSLSKSPKYLLGMEEALDRLLELPMFPAARRVLRRKKTSLRHDIAEHFKSEGELAQAWHYHMMTFAHHRGFCYLPSTIDLLRATVRRLFN